MTLIISTYVPEGIVMASDSRQRVTYTGKTSGGKETKVETVNSDAVIKTFLLENQQVGISWFGQDLLDGLPMASHIKRFEEERLRNTDDVESIAPRLVKFFEKSFPKNKTGFHVCGYYKKEEKVSIPHVYYCPPGGNKAVRTNVNPDDGSIIYNTSWAGEPDIITGLINKVVYKDPKTGKEIVVRSTQPILWHAMALQDAVDFSIFAVRTTIDTMRFQARPKTVGGSINVLVITPDSAKWVQKRELQGEFSSEEKLAIPSNT